MPKQDAEMGFTAVNAATGQHLRLAMQQLWLTGQLCPVGARLWLQHRFQSNEDKPLEVIYSFVLPRDAALRRFVVKGQDFSVRSDLRPVAEAEQTYEAGIEAGTFPLWFGNTGTAS
jgi:hypothetical protein